MLGEIAGQSHLVIFEQNQSYFKYFLQLIFKNLQVIIAVQNVLSFTVSKIAVLGSVVVKALCYKPEGRGFDTR
jgi:hypothetical protein